MPKLGVNVDHVATLRQARHKALAGRPQGESLPDPVLAAQAAEKAGSDSIVCHLREDRRHIQESDLDALKKMVRTSLNLEMSADPGIVRIACAKRPSQATLVPERRQELTTEGGLDLKRNPRRLLSAVQSLQKAKILVSLFIDPTPTHIRLASHLGVPIVEFHTGRYANSRHPQEAAHSLAQLREGVKRAQALGLIVAAGHGLDYRNVTSVAQIPGIEELNIGFSIVARAMEVGFAAAVREMAALVHGAPRG